MICLRRAGQGQLVRLPLELSQVHSSLLHRGHWFFHNVSLHRTPGAEQFILFTLGNLNLFSVVTRSPTRASKSLLLTPMPICVLFMSRPVYVQGTPEAWQI